jgi:MscS family membrane protein
MISLVYSTTTEQLAEISKSIKEHIDDSGDFVPEDQAARFVHVDSFAGSSIDMLVYCFTRSPAYADYLAAKERLVLSIKNAVESAGTSFALRNGIIPPLQMDTREFDPSRGIE